VLRRKKVFLDYVTGVSTPSVLRSQMSFLGRPDLRGKRRAMVVLGRRMNLLRASQVTPSNSPNTLRGIDGEGFGCTDYANVGLSCVTHTVRDIQ
jgi:hypothetical protein